MGITISFGGFHGGYHSFNMFRQAVARAIGGSYPPHDDPELDPKRWYWKTSGDGERYPGLTVFFTSDDSGCSILPRDCRKIAAEMEPLIPILDTYGLGPSHIARQGGYGQCARNYIAACREAVRLRRRLLYR